MLAKLIIHDATPAMADGMTVDPVLRVLAAELGVADPILLWEPRHENDKATEIANRVYLTLDKPVADIAIHARDYAAVYGDSPVGQEYAANAKRHEEYIAVGLTRYVQLKVGGTILRGDVCSREAFLLLNEDGTRGAILHSNL